MVVGVDLGFVATDGLDISVLDDIHWKIPVEGRTPAGGAGADLEPLSPTDSLSLHNAPAPPSAVATPVEDGADISWNASAAGDFIPTIGQKRARVEVCLGDVLLRGKSADGTCFVDVAWCQHVRNHLVVNLKC